MAAVIRLVTFVDVHDAVPDPRRMSLSARHEAVLDDGRHVLLLDDRGCAAEGPPNIWKLTSLQEIVFTARTVVGPDEPPPGRSQQEMAASHWAHLVEVLRRHGVAADAATLERLPHDVVLSDELLARMP